jgi:1,4-dihydroxy-2-naphthoate octaprenyltransferase
LEVGSAFYSDVPSNFWHVLLVLIDAQSTHIRVNAFNEYDNLRTGLDSCIQCTPFSGGSGTLRANPQSGMTALATAVISLSIAALVGGYFTRLYSLALMPLGLLGIFVIVAYTFLLTHSPWLCLIAPGLGFGALMEMGTHIALNGQYSWTSFVASLVLFFLVSKLLLLNQFPDVEADKTVGCRHFPILIGRHQSSFIFSTFLVLTYVSIQVGVILSLMPI